VGNIKLYKPHPKQREIHDALETDIKYCVVSIGRQFGKTLFAENQAVKWGLENKNWKVGWISPTYKQAKKVFKEIAKALADCIYVIGVNRGDLVIEFNNGSIIQFYSAEAYDSIRGETFDALICDEFAFFKPEAWNEVLKATVLVRGKKVLILSTPKGKNQFYNLFNLAEHNSNYISFRGSSYDNPFIDPEEIREAERNLPTHVFKQEYLAEFLDNGSSVFRNIQECVKSSVNTSSLYAGIDLGRSDDYTVLTIVDSNNIEVYSERWRHMEWSTIINNIVEQLNKYRPNTLVESNGAQDAIFEQIRNKVAYNKNSIQPFVTTSKSKQNIVEDLIVKFENKDIGIIGYDWQINELEVFTYEYNLKTRAIKYSAPVGLHDDYVMSRAITNHALKTMKASGKYFVY
tara:strand:+ start:1974 stop:3182 length:1209 start_codon:yes stop_codon:yes gene_type:complete